jgi:Head domain of trimeric autotransporter adhesin
MKKYLTAVLLLTGMVGAAQSKNSQTSIFTFTHSMQNAGKKITPIIKNATHLADTLPLVPCDDAIKYERATVASINSGIYWDVTGNAGLSSANFIGTTDAQPFIIKTANVQALKITGDGKRSINAQNAVSTGLISTAFNQATASGDYSFATGYLSNASGIGAVALGSSTASNTYATAFGNRAMPAAQLLPHLIRARL